MSGGPAVNIYADLFLTFAKVGVCTFGGGYAMLPILQREVVEKKGWAANEELTDYFAVGQCTPGIIAVNTATFIGYKYKGIPGGVLATLGVVFPSLIIITAIAAFLSNFAGIPVVRHALAGINAAVVALIASSVQKLAKSNLKDAVSVCIFLAGIVLAFFAGVSPTVLIVCAGAVGYTARALAGRKGGGERISCACILSLPKWACSPWAEAWPPFRSFRIWGRAPAGSPTPS